MLHFDMNLYYVYLESHILKSSSVFSLAFMCCFISEFVCLLFLLL